MPSFSRLKPLSSITVPAGGSEIPTFLSYAAEKKLSKHPEEFGKGAIEGRLGWAGSPLTPDLGTMNGQLHLKVVKGQFLQVDPGVARLLGVFSLQSVPRRLRNDPYS